MKRSTISYSLTAAVLLFVALNSAAQKVITKSENNFDFENSRRYAWTQNHIITRQGRENDALIDQEIVKRVNAVLAAKGFTEDDANPDLYIFYDAGSSDATAKMEGKYSHVSNASTASVGPIYNIPQNVWYSVDGHITFHIVKAKSNQTIWTTLVTKKIRDPRQGMKDMPKQVEQIVSKSFSKFPPDAR